MLFKTSRVGTGRGSHYHIIYMGQQQALSSTDLEHSHQVDFDGSSFVVQPSGKDNHIHVIVGELETEPKIKTQSDISKVNDVLHAYKQWMELEQESREAGEESEDFISNNQWDEKTRQELWSKDRAASTINEIEGKLDVLSGYQRQNRTDIKFLPVEGSDQRAADIYTILVKNILEQNNFEYEETEVFEDGMVAGRGFFNVYVDYNNNVDGEIVVERFPWKNAALGPHNKKDFKDGEGLVKFDWFSKAKLESMFPDKADQLAAELEYFEKGQKILDNPVDQYDPSIANKVSTNLPDNELVNIARKDFKVIELWRKEFKSAPVIRHQDGFMFEGVDLSATDINKISTIEGMQVIKRKKPFIRVTTVASRVLLEDEFPDLAVQTFHLIPFYAKKNGSKFWGKVEPVKDLQREINKRHSQAIDIMNKVAPYGWFIDPNTFKSPVEKERFKANVSSPGFVQEILDLTRKPEQVDGVKFPNELANLMQLDSQKIREVMNINIEMLGQAQRAESGIAIVEKRRGQLVGNEFLFDNLSLAKRTLGRLLVSIIQRVYNPQRILRVLESRAMREAIEIGGEALIPQLPPEQLQGLTPEQQLELANQIVEQRRAELLEILNNTDTTKFDVAVGENAWSPTTRQANFIMWAELAGRGIPVPPDLLIDLSDLPDKDKVKEMIRAQAQAQAELEQAKMQTEIIKTQIAKSNQGGTSS